MTGHKNILSVLFVCCLAVSARAQESVLRTGDWLKFSIEKSGVYKISFDNLRRAGIDPAKVNPQNVRIYGQGGGMLPQANDVPRSALIENAIFVSGESDGIFHKSDFILFYAEGPDEIEYNLTREAFYYQNNLYSDKNFYFLTVGDDAGKRLSTSENTPGDFPVIDSFDDYAVHEVDEFNLERSGREWFGEKFGTTSIQSFSFNIPGIAPGSDIKLISDVLGQTYSEASFNLYFNNVWVAEQNILPVPSGRYSVRGLHKRDTISFRAADVNAENRADHEMKYEFVKGSGFSQGYLDFILIQVRRVLSLYNNQTAFVSQASLMNAISTFAISGATDDISIWNISDPYNVQSQSFNLDGESATFSVATDVLKKFIVFNNSLPEPVFVGRIENQNLSGLSTPNLLIVTYPDFEEQAHRLAAHRESHDNWTVEVVTTTEIFNEFSSGRQDVTAIRDFAKHLRDKNPAAFKAILLFGKASYDYKDRLINNTNFVPTYQSRNSLHPLQTYSSDDYFAFLENNEGSWTESPAQHHTLDVGIGRLPVSTIKEAQTVVDKIIHYDTNARNFGSWRKKIVFVADDGNTEDGFTSLHQYQADQLATIIEQDNPAFDTRKIYMGSYKKVVQPNGEKVPDMEADIKRSFDQGSLIINFTGHGSEVVWTDERILNDKTIDELDNHLHPFLVTATCEFGRQDDPLQISSAERSVTHTVAGAIGLVTTARPVNATTNFNLNQAFYESLFEQSGSGYATIGEVFQKTKNNSASGVANRNFSLIGDPSMVLAMPKAMVNVDEIKTASGSDTLNALSEVTVKGTVLGPDGVALSTFNGAVEATLFDKQVEHITTGKNNPAFVYQQWDNALFRGQASVKNGLFEFTFIMPKNISYQIGEGKFSFYAYDKTSGIDAKGVNNELKIGGSETIVGGDSNPPEIELFIGDTTFVNGGITTSDTRLIARLSDNSGINISGYGIGNSLVAQLDNEGEQFVLNDYYVSDLDTYQRGSVVFPIKGMSPGRHTLTLKAWDVYNNPGQATVDFLVTDGQGIVIESFGNYPNPFQEVTSLFFTHNRSGDDIEAQLFIYSPAGELLKSTEISIPESEYRINLMELNAFEASGKKLSPGLYLARLIIRSMTNGSKNEQVTKLIILN